MNVTIEHPFCPYCSEVTNLYFRIINTLLFSKDENELRTSMESLKKETRLDEYFTFGYGAHHLWICQRKPSDKNKIFPHWKSHATLTLLATQDLPTFGYNMIAPLKSWCWGSILFYPFKISRFS